MDAGVDAGWSSLVARRAHNPKVVGSNPAPATTFKFRWRRAIGTQKAPSWGFLLGAFKAIAYKASGVVEAPGAGKGFQKMHLSAFYVGFKALFLFLEF